LHLVGSLYTIHPGRGKKSFSPVHLPDTGTLFKGLKRLEPEAHLSSSEVKNGVEVYLHFLLPHTFTCYGV